MSVPKVFISSTCYDLLQIRSDLQHFIQSFGYEAIASDKYNVPYNVKPNLEEDCYSEIRNCDIVIGIIGGKYGSEAKNKDGKSISMVEMLSAIDSKKQMYIFIDSNVDSEFYTYKKNIDKEINYAHVDNIEIFKFIDKLRESPSIVINNFTTASDIIICLTNQWAGLFQSFLNNKERQSQNDGLIKIDQTACVLADLIIELKTTSERLKNTINDSLSKKVFGETYINHVLVDFSQTLLKSTAVIFIKTRDEMEEFLKIYDSFELSSEDENFLIYKNHYDTFTVSTKIFNADGNIIYMTAGQVDSFKVDTKLFEFSSEMPDDTDLPF